MQNGLITIEKTDEKVEAIFVDQEVLECALLNQRTKKRVQETQKKKAEAVRRQKRMRKTANRIMAEASFGMAVAVAGSCGMIAPVIWIPVTILSMCAACVHFGAWYTKAVKK